MRFALVNRSTCVPPDAAAAIATAQTLFLQQHFGPAWGRVFEPVELLPDEGAARAGGRDALVLVDEPDPAVDGPGLAAYHDETGDKPYARIFAKLALDHGGTLLRGPGSVSVLATHELEMAENEAANLWAQGPDGRMYAREACDPVEGTCFDVITSSGPVSVANFVLPAWFDPQATTGSFDKLGLLSGPFRALPTGYMIVGADAGSAQPQFGAEVPTWRTKRSSFGRAARCLTRQQNVK